MISYSLKKRYDAVKNILGPKYRWREKAFGKQVFGGLEEYSPIPGSRMYPWRSVRNDIAEEVISEAESKVAGVVADQISSDVHQGIVSPDRIPEMVDVGVQSAIGKSGGASWALPVALGAGALLVIMLARSR